MEKVCGYNNLLYLCGLKHCIMKRFIKAVIIGYVTLWLFDTGKAWWENRNRPTFNQPDEDDYSLSYSPRKK